MTAAKKASVPISITYDTDNSWYIVLCSDGTIWKRICVRHPDGRIDDWEWIQFESFTGL